MPVKLQIPNRYTPALAEFLRLSPEELENFLAALRTEKPTLRESDLVQSIESRLSYGGSRVRDIVRLFISLYLAWKQEREPIESFVAALRSAAEGSGKADLMSSDWSVYGKSLAEALSSDTAIAVAAKAFDVMSDHQRVYCHARVLTDLRPVFTEVVEPPAAVVAIHTLKIVYHEEGEHREFFVALDRLDAIDLAAHLERALNKEDSLKVLSNSKGLSFLEAT